MTLLPREDIFPPIDMPFAKYRRTKSYSIASIILESVLFAEGTKNQIRFSTSEEPIMNFRLHRQTNCGMRLIGKPVILT